MPRRLPSQRRQTVMKIGYENQHIGIPTSTRRRGYRIGVPWRAHQGIIVLPLRFRVYCTLEIDRRLDVCQRLCNDDTPNGSATVTERTERLRSPNTGCSGRVVNRVRMRSGDMRNPNNATPWSMPGTRSRIWRLRWRVQLHNPAVRLPRTSLVREVAAAH